jgi:Cytochrome c oxidase assembly protein CtaG/Cox11
MRRVGVAAIVGAPTSARRRAVSILAGVALGLTAGCAKERTPVEIALEYGRAVYANDPAAIYRLVSAEDRRVQDEATFRRQQPDLSAFSREVMQQLASYVTATPVRATVTAARATVTLRFRLPDANAPDIVRLLHDWDDQRLGALPAAERTEIRHGLEAMHRTGRLPTIEGDETVELVKDPGGWRVFVKWAGAVRVRFNAAIEPGLPLEVTVTPAGVVLNRGERARVTVRARNRGRREVTTRVGHRIEPGAQAKHLALLQCPLFVPITLEPGETRDFVSVYFLPPDAPADAKDFSVTYQFPARSGDS